LRCDSTLAASNLRTKNALRRKREPGKENQMSDKFKLIAVSLLFLVGLSACDSQKPGESAGKKIDQTASDAGKKITEAVDKVGEKLSEQSAKTGTAIDDAEITAKTKAAIFAEPGLKTLQISVDTVAGVVTLSGSVDTPANSEMAKSLAGAVAGVKEVRNQLVVKPAN
jgi:hyperosmotically inducible periplasmic protein